MAIRLQVDSLDGLPAHVAELYIADDDGKFRLDVEGVPDVSKLEGALRKERDARKSAERAAAQQRERLHGDVEAAFSIERQALERAHADELAKLQHAVEGAKQDVARARAAALDARLQEAARAAGVHAAAVRDAVRAGKEAFTVGDDGALVATEDSRMTVASWFRERLDDSPHWFPATGSGGGAAHASAGAGIGTGIVTRRLFDGMTPTQQAAHVRAGYRIVD